jgi:hypothetical protein
LSRAELGWYQRCAQVSFTARVLRAVTAWLPREGVAGFGEDVAEFVVGE